MLVLLLASLIPGQDADYAKYRHRFVEADGKFYRVPEKLPATTRVYEPTVGTVKQYELVRAIKIRSGDQDMVVIGTFTTGILKQDTKPFRVWGHSTEGLVDNTRLKESVTLVSVGTCDVGGTRMFLTVPLDMAKKGLSEEQFRRLLKADTKLDP